MGQLEEPRDTPIRWGACPDCNAPALQEAVESNSSHDGEIQMTHPLSIALMASGVIYCVAYILYRLVEII